MTCTGLDMLECRGFSATATMKDLPLKVGGGYSWEDNSRGFDPNRSERLTSEEPADEDDAMAMAQAVMLDRSLRFQRCEVKTQGNPRIVPGNRLTVKGLGEFFSGEYMVFSVAHTLSAESGFVTECVLRRNFCETAVRKGSTSGIDRERAESKLSGGTEENAAIGSVAADSGSESGKQENEEESSSSGKNPAITNPRWENADGQTITKALVGDEIFICADVTDIADGASATIKIVEKDADGNDDFVAEERTTIQDGKIRCRWKVIYTEDNDDTNSQKELEEKGYTLPEYAFTVEYGGTESGESGQLDVLGWIKTQFKDKKTGLPLSNKKYTIYLSNGNEINGISDNEGFVEQKELKMGDYYIEFKE